VQNTASSLRLQGQDRSESTHPKLWQERCRAHKQRCGSLPPLSPNEAKRLVEEFLAKRGGVTRCPPAYAVSSSATTVHPTSRL
jgi:hypothetical protein